MAYFQIIKQPSAWWTANNPVLQENEIGVESSLVNGVEVDTLQGKLGNGLDVWSDLPYWNSTGLITGTINCSANPNYPAGNQGDVYVVSAGGLIGGAAGAVVEAGDLVVCTTTNAGGTQAQVGADWDVIQTNIGRPFDGYTTTATAAATTTLDVASTFQQFFTGTTTQIVKLPVTSTLTVGWTVRIVNNSTGAVTVNSSGSNAVLVLAAGTSAFITCIALTHTTAADWSVTYIPITSGGLVRAADGTTALPAYSFASDPNTGIISSAADAIGFVTGGTEQWVVNSSGALNPTTNSAKDIGNGAVNPRDVNIARYLALYYSSVINARISENSSGNMVFDQTTLAPGACTATLAGAGAGNVDSGTHSYKVTFITASGQTDAGTASNTVTTTGGDGQVNLTAIPIGGAEVTQRKIYRTAAGGSDYLLLTTIVNNVDTTFADNIADSSLTTAAPSTNSAIDTRLTLDAGGSLTLPPIAGELGYLNIPQNVQSAPYTLVLADAGQHIYHPASDANAREFTIPANASVAFPLGTAVTFVNDSANDVTVVITSDTLHYADVGAITTLTIPQYNQATVLKVLTTQWNASGTAGCTTA